MVGGGRPYSWGMAGNPDETPVRVYADQPFVIPDVCACCLAPKEVDANVQLYVGYNQFVLVPMSWCRDCKGRQTRATLVLVLLMFSAGALGLVVPITLLGTSDLGYGIGAVGFIGGLMAGAVIAVKLRKGGQRQGHAPGCDAVGSLQGETLGTEGRRGGHLRFQNAEFARRWQQLNPPG